ncbi:unnamed protein product [Symbiodinium pilosum]|uniref:Mechanosensitive ion channel MscS domain-containing protein n=1 Tax=Symbiodinium pilosum TaxID=2952 RepID=A0A812RP95_SYMPI|nr:unnamed protein product [Symbiodinium pilosum]
MARRRVALLGGDRASFVNALPAKPHGIKYRKHSVKAGHIVGTEADSESAARVTVGLLGGISFWWFMYWLFFKAIEHITKIVQGNPELEIATFVFFSIFPMVLAQKGFVKWGVDRPLRILARYMPTVGLRHIVLSAIPGMHNVMTGLLVFFAVNLLTAAVPEGMHFELPQNLKALLMERNLRSRLMLVQTMDPDGNGILTGVELESVVQNCSVKILTVLMYLEAGLFGLYALAKPKKYKAVGNDVIDVYWRSVEQKLPKAVVLSVLLYSAILLTTVSGVLKTLGFSPRSILALGGVSGLAFGLASQNLVGNFMSGILLIVNRQFTIGDVIETNGITGKVMAMGWTFIEIQRGDDLVMLPNSQVVGTTVIQIGHFSQDEGDTATAVE